MKSWLDHIMDHLLLPNKLNSKSIVDACLLEPHTKNAMVPASKVTRKERQETGRIFVESDVTEVRSGRSGGCIIDFV